MTIYDPPSSRPQTNSSMAFDKLTRDHLRGIAEPEIDGQMRAATDTLARAGLEIDECLSPFTKRASLLVQPTCLEGLAHSMAQSGVMPDLDGLSSPSLDERFAAWRQHWCELPATAIALVLFGALCPAATRGATTLRRSARAAPK
ncbi:MAG: hypothetical protein OXK82_04805 [Deltaproteobacteria bacterium]|nr:hypothetical protein [Deltaproteobacteria bacterium]